MADAQQRDRGICYTQPHTTEQRVAIAREFVQRFKHGIPLLVDPIENQANHLYAGWPERLYVLEGGVIRYEGGLGPFELHSLGAQSSLTTPDQLAATG